MADQDNEPPKKGPPPLPGGLPPLSGKSGGPPPIPGMGGGRPTPPPLPGQSQPSSGAPKPPPLPGGPAPSLPPGLSELLGETKKPGGLPPLAGGGAPALPSLPNMPSIPRPPMAGAPGMPSMPGMGGMPSLPGAPGLPSIGAAVAPAAPQAPQPPQRPPEKDFTSEKLEYEKKLAEMEKRLQEEREKLLVANLRAQEEQAASARVEVSIKELQDKLRRERRDAEQEENRLKLEQRLQEQEARLAQERETWVTTLRNQMQARESQDKEIETHFGLRIQEMERKWLEEKAQWQKVALAKDDEIRNLRSLAEKLKGADIELQKAVSEKKFLQDKTNELTMERGELMSRAQIANEKEKDNIQLRADLSVLKERLERELQSVRMSAKEREERLMADLERLQREVLTLPERQKGEHEAEIRRVKMEVAAELAQYREKAEKNGADLLKLRGIAGALERQLAAAKVSNAGLEKNQERFKAEFVVLQRKWVEREKEIRGESQNQASMMLEAEKTKIKIMAQDEINARAAKIAEQLQKEREADLRRAEATMRAEFEKELATRTHKSQADWDAARKSLEAEIDRLHQEHFKKEQEWSSRLMAKDSDLHSTGVKADDLSGRLSRADEARQKLEREALELSKGLQASREEVGGLAAVTSDLKEKVDRLTRERDELHKRAEDLERLATAQAAQVNSTQQTLDQLRSELSRETHLVKMYIAEKEELKNKLQGGQ